MRLKDSFVIRIIFNPFNLECFDSSIFSISISLIFRVKLSHGSKHGHPIKACSKSQFKTLPKPKRSIIFRLIVVYQQIIFSCTFGKMDPLCMKSNFVNCKRVFHKVFDIIVALTDQIIICQWAFKNLF